MDAKILKGPKIKEKSPKSDKSEPSEKAQEQNERKKNIFHPSGIVSNLSKTRLQKYSALKHVSEFKEKFNPGKLASTAKMEPKQIIFKN